MKFSYSTGNLIFFGFLIILLILPIFDRHKIGKFQTQKSLLGIRLWAITYLPMERARCLLQINAIKFLGNPAGKMFERQTKATLEVKTRHFVTTFEAQKQRYSRLTRYLCFFSHGTLSICRDNLFLSSYMPCAVHSVGNRLPTNDILRLAISILAVAVESALNYSFACSFNA